LLGFSLGGLLGLVWAQARGLTLRRAALLAPGLRLKPLHRALIERVMPLLPRGLWLPSVSPRSYRFHAGTTLSAYRTVATLQRRLAPRLRA
jgi:alpha-beta hydrolase superfamily lysophospholipase